MIYRVAVGAVAVQYFKWSEYAPSIAFALVGSLLAGYLCARLWMPLTQRIEDAPSAIIMKFAGTFTLWIVAEHIGLSGILTIVAYAITLARTAPAETPARLRVPTYAVWDTVVFVLNVLAFVLIGLQLRPIWERLDDPVRLKYCLVAAAVLGIVILTRIAWVMSYGVVLRLLIARGILTSMIAPDRSGWHCRLLVRHARHRHAGGGVRAARKLSLSRPDAADGVHGGAGIACDSGPDTPAADRGAAAERREPGDIGSGARPRGGLSGGTG